MVVVGCSQTQNHATGYEDAKVNIELIIDDTPSQTKYQRLAVVVSHFRKPGQTVPQPIPIVSEDTVAHGIDKVWFKGVSHKAENKKGQLAVTLEFWEHVPQTITAKKKGKGSGSGSSTGATITSEYGSYLESSRGSSPKLNSSPAVDDASPSAALNRVSQMPY